MVSGLLRKGKNGPVLALVGVRTSEFDAVRGTSKAMRLDMHGCREMRPGETLASIVLFVGDTDEEIKELISRYVGDAEITNVHMVQA